MYSTLLLDVISACKKSGMQPIVMGHLGLKADEAGNDFLYKCALQGQIGKKGLESEFSIVMHAMNAPLEDLEDQDHEWLGHEESIKGTGSRFVYQVELTEDTAQSHAIRSIRNLWPKGVTHIDNNLQIIFDRMDEVYNT